MNLKEYMSGLKKSSKLDDVPGTVAEILEQLCPACERKLRRYKPCCGSKYGYVGCICGYKYQLDGSDV